MSPCEVVHHHVLQGELYIIDVSQSVELDHPLALDFLREDISHINAFFRRAGVATLTMRELFDFVVDPSINNSNIEAALDQLRAVAGRYRLHCCTVYTAADRANRSNFGTIAFVASL